MYQIFRSDIGVGNMDGPFRHNWMDKWKSMVEQILMNPGQIKSEACSMEWILGIVPFWVSRVSWVEVVGLLWLQMCVNWCSHSRKSKVKYVKSVAFKLFSVARPQPKETFRNFPSYPKINHREGTQFKVLNRAIKSILCQFANIDSHKAFAELCGLLRISCAYTYFVRDTFALGCAKLESALACIIHSSNRINVTLLLIH